MSTTKTATIKGLDMSYVLTTIRKVHRSIAMCWDSRQPRSIQKVAVPNSNSQTVPRSEFGMAEKARPGRA